MTVLVTDPVCGMEIDPTKAAGMSEFNGQRYYFCAESCKDAFDAEPSKYIEGGPIGMSAASAGKRWWEFWKT